MTLILLQVVAPAVFNFFFFGPHPQAYGGSQASGLIRAVAAGLCHSNARSKRLRPTPQLMATLDP